MRSADTTRLLVLGVVAIFEPANGYQLRRELLSWDVERWANVQPGSIYSMLGTLTKQGMVERFDLSLGEGGRPVAVYRSTPAGREELRRLVREGIVTVNQLDQSAAYAAMSLMFTVLPREEVVPLLERRQVALKEAATALRTRREALTADRGTPPHVPRLLEYSVGVHEAELAWLRGFTASVRAGELAFVGEQGEEWVPAEDDPGWRMVREREDYLRAIAELER